jgi:hypothetical protein
MQKQSLLGVFKSLECRKTQVCPTSVMAQQ